MLRATPPGEDGLKSPRAAAVRDDELENRAQDMATDGARRDDETQDDDDEFDEQPTDQDFLQMVVDADAQAKLYSSQVNRQSWERSYRAYHQEHFDGSKYKSTDFKNRSRLFIPKTRAAVRKDMAAVAASLFGSLDAVNCMAGNEGDPEQRASAAVVQELVNYRTDRTSGKASIPWFHVAMGARQTAILTGICLTKQSWKLELQRSDDEEVEDEETGEKKLREVWKPYIDRPDCQLIPPENFIIDPAADWTNPAQNSSYVIIKWPMRLDEIRMKQRDPRKPWKELPESVLKASSGAKTEAATIRRAREQGIDRMDETSTGNQFDVIWVWECFVRTAGEDWTFLCLAGEEMLTDPEPVRNVYPEQFGERPLALGYGAIEAFRIFPMSAAESWQMLQQEANDVRNLTLDAFKQNVMPITKVVRGRQVDLEQLKRRGQGTSIMVNKADDVTWEKPPDVPQSAMAIKQQLDIEFDDLSGQQNYGTVSDNNALGKTLGGLKLAAGAANAVQEFDIRVWIETWCEPALMQIVRLEQFYESDPIVLGLCGERAKLLEKYGINEISDQLLENNVTIRVNIGLGAGDPQQRLAKFNSAMQVAVPLLQLSPAFKSGKKVIDDEAVMSEVFGAAGYRDGGSRFVKDGEQQQDPAQEPTIDKIKSEAEKNRAMAKKAVIDALSGAAKVGIAMKDLELQEIEDQFHRHVAHTDQIGRAKDMGFRHGDAHIARQNVANGLAPDGSPIDTPEEEAQVAAIKAEDGAAPAPQAPSSPPGMPPLPPQPAMDAGPAPQEAPAQKRQRKISITKRGPDGRASEFNIED